MRPLRIADKTFQNSNKCTIISDIMEGFKLLLLQGTRDLPGSKASRSSCDDTFGRGCHVALVLAVT